MGKQPIVMGILNTTPDSFFDGGSYLSENHIIERVEQMIKEGVSIIDVGGFSTQPNFAEVSENEEIDRVLGAVEVIHKFFPRHQISVDTFRSNVAKKAISAGATMINDISGGNFDAAMFRLIAEHPNVEYVLMHCGTNSLKELHKNVVEENVVEEEKSFFEQKLQQLAEMGINPHRIILDQGFGFGKTILQNFELMRAIPEFVKMGRVLVGISRKSMIFKTLKTVSQKSLTGTIALNMIALINGAEILRVHDVKEATETIEIFKAYINNNK